MDDSKGLTERLSAVSEDKTADAQGVVRETASVLSRWLKDRPLVWEKRPDLAGAELEAGLENWVERQAWRGSCANFLQALRIAFSSVEPGGNPRAELMEELSAWAEPSGDPGGPLPDPESVAPHALRTLERGEEILVHGRSEAILESLRRAQTGGLFPKVTLALGASDQSGKFTARYLASHGIAVRLVWDAALMSCVANSDHIWMGTEGVGPAAFLGWLGGNSIIAEALRLDIPVSVLCTTDACLPGGDMSLPNWGNEEHWQLWSRGPEGVHLEAQPYEIIDVPGVANWMTEEGPGALADLCIRHQRLGIAPPCGSTYDHHDQKESPGSPGLMTTLSDD